jgi:hypothetical protein
MTNLHKEGFGVIDYEGNKVPCIYLNKNAYENIIKKSFGKKYIVEVLLNIFYDGYYVFVDIQLEMTNLGIEENFLIHANTSLEFFECLYENGLLAIIPKEYSTKNSSNLFMIQLPNRGKIENAITIIRNNIERSCYEKSE